MRHGIRWLAATVVFVAILAGVLTATRPQDSQSAAGPGAAIDRSKPSLHCPKPRRGVLVGGRPRGEDVALSFDDGPSPATPSILRVLRRHHAHATFFVIGGQIRGHEQILRRAVRAGNEIGNHSTSHVSLPDRRDIATTSRLIASATGRPPCLFRPPDGDTSPGLLHDVHSLGMTTVAWDVDTVDWRDQAPADIRARALAAAHRGAIILLHDGGGNRMGTVSAVSGIVDSLHQRGYRVVTVSELLGR